jgi:uncharacterized protein YgbK (DUF1537 family)
MVTGSQGRTPGDLLLAYYGDDFTGSTDALEALVSAGVPTVLCLQTPTPALLARFPGVRAVGLAGQARGKTPTWMREHLAPALQALAALGAPILHYKVCSTFDSSPAIGSIGCAIDLGLPLMGGTWSPLIVGAPRLGRHTAFGHLFAVANGVGHRLDRHPTMARHPVTPMAESDLRLHLGQQTARRCELIDFAQLKAGHGAARLAAIQAAGSDLPLVLIDVLDDDTLRTAGALVWAQRGAGLFSASSSGLSHALAAHWQSTGLIDDPAVLPATGAVRQIAAVSGSCSPGTAAQIAWAAAHGFATLRLDVPRLLADAAGEAARVVDLAAGVLAEGGSPLVFTASGPNDPAVAGFDAAAAAAGLGRTEAAERTGQGLATVLCGLLERVPALRRVAVAGGDSSGAVTAALDLQALTLQARLVPGAPLCRAWSDRPGRDGLEIVLKGGQMGGDDFFGLVRDGPAPADPVP